MSPCHPIPVSQCLSLSPPSPCPCVTTSPCHFISMSLSLCHLVPMSPHPHTPWPPPAISVPVPIVSPHLPSPPIRIFIPLRFVPHPLARPHVSPWCHLHTCPRVPAAGPWRDNAVMWRCCRDGATALPIRATCQQRGQRVTTAGGCRDAFLQCCEVAQNLRRRGQRGGLARGECQQCPQSGEGWPLVICIDVGTFGWGIPMGGGTWGHPMPWDSMTWDPHM